MTDILKTDPAKNAAIAAGLTFAFYAMPDFIRSRTLRFFGKSAILAASTTQALGAFEGDWDEGAKELKNFLEEADEETLVATAGAVAGVGSLSTALVVVGEKAIYRRAEKKRAEGKKLSHTKQALVLAALTGGMLYALEVTETN